MAAEARRTADGHVGRRSRRQPDPAACKSGESQTITVTYAKMVGSIVTDVNGPPGDSPAPGVGLKRNYQPVYSYHTSGRHVENDAKTGDYTVSTNSAGPKQVTDPGTNIAYYVSYDGGSNIDHFTLRRGQTVHVSVNYAVVKGHIREPGGSVRDVDPGVYRPGDFGYRDSESTSKGNSNDNGCFFTDLNPHAGDTCTVKTRYFDSVDSTDYTPNVFGVSSGETKRIYEHTSHHEYTTLLETNHYKYCDVDNKIYTGGMVTTYTYDSDYKLIDTSSTAVPGNSCPQNP